MFAGSFQPRDRLAHNDSEKGRALIRELVLYTGGAMAYHERPIAPDRLNVILEAVAPCTLLSQWKLIAVTDARRIATLVTAFQQGLRENGFERHTEFMDRWKKAPLILVFCMPRPAPFQWVPADAAHPLALIELGQATQNATLVARAHGIETHWIASVLLARQEIRAVLDIPNDVDPVFFAVMGYASEEVAQQFPSVEETCYAEAWGTPLRLTSNHDP